MNADTIKQLQTSLGLPATGIFDPATSAAMTSAIGKAVSTNPTVQQYAGNNTSDAIVNAYQSGDWSGVTSLSGKPFTPEQQQAAVAQSSAALAPAYQAQEANDQATTEDSLRTEQEKLASGEKADATTFKTDKNTLDQNAADQGVLFSGSRVQKQNDLRTAYQDRSAAARSAAAENIGSTLRGYQYDYGNNAASKLSDMYRLPGATSYNAGVAGGAVTPSKGLSSVYNPSAYNFQGTKPVAQTAAVQTRAAGLLANKANKLTLSGYNTQY